MREDHFTNTPEDAAAYERERAQTAGEYDWDRPTLADEHDAERDDDWHWGVDWQTGQPT